jgi:hypothetical protein
MLERVRCISPCKKWVYQVPYINHWCKLEVDTNKHEDFNLVHANHGEEDETNPLPKIEIAEAQKKDLE